MKKSIFIALLSASLILVSCGKSEISNKESQTNNNLESTSRKENKVSKDECMNGCYIMWKQNPGNKGKSEDIMNNNCKDLCNASQGIQNNDIESCEKSSDPILKNPCFGEVAKSKGDVTICDKITEKLMKDACIMGVAEKLKDESLCDKISEPIMKPACIDGVKNK